MGFQANLAVKPLRLILQANLAAFFRKPFWLIHNHECPMALKAYMWLIFFMTLAHEKKL